MSATTKPLVLVVSGTGTTGLSILKGLAKTGAWRLAASVRPSSIDRPEVSELRELGVEIRPCDWQKASAAELDTLFKDAETVISACNLQVILDQSLLVDAAKRSPTVKRFIPCDFGTPCPAGVMDLKDDKLKIQDYIKQQKVPYTFIDVGFWMQISLPYKSGSTHMMVSMLSSFYGDGEVTTAVINKDHIGTYVSRIIADPRTLNQYVFAYEVETSQKETYEICSRIAGEDFRKSHETVTPEELKERAAKADPIYGTLWLQYQYSKHVRGDNCSKFAKKLGALDANELYPDIEKQSLEDFAKEFYAEAK